MEEFYGLFPAALLLFFKLLCLILSYLGFCTAFDAFLDKLFCLDYYYLNVLFPVLDEKC